MSRMKPVLAAVFAVALATLSAPALAVDEPAVRETVIDDGRARIEELRVRGQVQRISVAPKGVPRYEIIVGDGSRDLSEGANTSRGAAGKRVWNVLQF
jgi:hypothetical protein